jgi:hypothetical protein
MGKLYRRYISIGEVMYIGNTPADKFQTLQKQSFTTSATDTYTLSYSVTNPQDLALFINNVRQNPNDAYSVSGTTLTLSSAITSSDTMYAVFLGRAVETVAPAIGSVTNSMLSGSIANAKLANSSITLNGTAVSLGGSANAGITEADIWRITANLTGDQTPISSGWERADTDNQTYIGTGMTESSGIFTFPSTGKYLINFTGSVINNVINDVLIALIILSTTNNSSYANASLAYTSVDRANAYNNATATLLFDVENTSTHKVKFHAENILSTTNLEGHTSQNETYATFIRLGDT